MSRAMNRLTKWWNEHNDTTRDQFTAKLEEYGAGDLYRIGHAFADIANLEVDDETAFELGCAFYVVGKIERILSAHRAGVRPSDDSWLDLHVYAKMVLAQREGVWPS